MKLDVLGKGTAYLRAAFLGFSKTGKTATSAYLAMAVKKHFKLKQPIGIFDTEGSSEYIAPMLESHKCGLVGLRSRSLDDLMEMGREAEKECSVLIVDSITHVWRECMAAYLKEMNSRYPDRPARTRVEMNEYEPIKEKFAEWTRFFVNSRLHIIVCVRAAYEYDWEQVGESDKLELVKTGVKMKTETEFGYEPSLLVEMEREEFSEGDKRVFHRATVIGDRWGAIDGQSAVLDNCPESEYAASTAKFFAPHFEKLRPGEHKPVDVEPHTSFGLSEIGESTWYQEKRKRDIFTEEIRGTLLQKWPGQTVDEKKARADMIFAVFNTYSETKLSTLNSKVLSAGLTAIREQLEVTK